MENADVKSLESAAVCFQDLCVLKEREDLRNILILDYGRFSRKQEHLDAVLSCNCLNKHFYVVIINEAGHCSDVINFPPTFKQQNCSILKVPPSSLRNVGTIQDHVVTQMLMFLQQYHCRRAYYCLSLDSNFPDGSKIMEHTGYEYTYCTVIKSVNNFVYLDKFHFRESDDPAKMTMFPLLRNDVPRVLITENSGKLLFFCLGEKYYGTPVASLWEELEQFGNKYSLHVSVTTAFPSVDYEVIKEDPEITKPIFYRFAIYLCDTSEDNVLSILEYLRPTNFEGAKIGLKLDSSTQKGQFFSAGSRNISRATYKICKYAIQKEHFSEDNKKYFVDIEDKQMVQLIDEAKNGGYTMKVRHAKILFCGASGAGKTSFVRLLKNKKFKPDQHSTELGNTQQIVISRKASIQGTNWVDLYPAEELRQVKLRLHHKLVFKPQPFCSEQHVDSTKEESIVNTEQFNSCQQDVREFSEKPQKLQAESLDNPSFKTAKFKPVLTEKRLCSKSPNLTKDYEEPLPIWDILTLLDTGGQPQFINMLPAVNTSATVMFVVLNMLHVLGAKGFDERVLVHHYKNGIKSYEPYTLNYTNKDLIKCLVALLKDSIITDVPLPDVTVLQKGRDSKPGLCFVGTHLDQVNEKDVDTVSDQLEEIVSQLEPSDNVSIWNCNKILFAVDNTLSGKQEYSQDSIANQICSEIKAILDEKAVYEVPITWILLELEIRRICGKGNKSFIAISEVVELFQEIIPGCDKKSAEVQVKAALRFHHMFGILLYFHNVPNMKDFVISNPQWLFTNLTNFVCFSFDGRIVDRKALNNLKSKGILSKSLIDKIKTDKIITDSLGGIKLEFFLELLKYFNIITPYPTYSSDYLMLTVLDSYKDETALFDVMPPLVGVEFVIQFNSGTFPRGVFCCLIVQLVQKVENWKLQVSLEGKRCVYADFVMFCTNSGQYVLLHDKITHLEIQIRKNVKTGSIHCEVQQTIVNMLQQMQQSTGTDFKCAFYCKSKPCLIYLSSHHVTGQKPLPNGLICENHGFVELQSCSHKLWCDITKASLAMSPRSRFSVFKYSSCSIIDYD
ncbi:uncharacterized protein [Dysidea avara]|uniref:uncharacterized protein isoform X3 n=1 Tax=Dysidea avara TaxID=196820 RepID=UPI003324A717